MSWKPFKLILVVVLFVISFPSTIFAAQAKIQGDYCYTYGDNESLVEARRLAYSYALRDAVEKSGVHLTSSTKAVNYSVIYDIIQNKANGYLTNLKTVRHTEKNRTICYTITANSRPIENVMSENEAREAIMKGLRRITLPTVIGVDYAKMTDKELLDFVYNKWYSHEMTKEEFLMALYQKFVLKNYVPRKRKKDSRKK